MTSQNWIDADMGRALRARIQQRTDWLRAMGQDHSTERLARDLDRSAGTIAHHLRIDAGRTKKNPALRALGSSQTIIERPQPEMTQEADFFKGFGS